MINKIFCYFFLFEMILALAIALQGINEVSMSKEFLAFLNQCNNEMQGTKLEIPKINKLDYLGGNEWWQYLFNTTIGFLNGCIGIINFATSICNFLIQLFQFIYITLKNSIVMKDNIISNSTTSYQQIAQVLMSC